MKKRAFLQTYYSYGLAIAIGIGLLIISVWGDLKPTVEISWLDVFSEGGMVILALFWLALLLRSRPAGRVTQLLALGLCAIVFSWSMDVADEFIRMPSTLIWHNWLESLPIPIALVLLSIGIYHWHQEEIAISAQMVKRERYFREHRLFDKLIPVGGAAYLKKQLKLSLAESKKLQQPLALIAVDLDNFNMINRRYGAEESDHILQLICQLLLLNLRDEDLICRLAGDRFVVLLHNTSENEAQQMSMDLQNAVASFAYRTREHHQRVFLSATVVTTMARTDDSDSLIKRLNLEISKTRQQPSNAI
ncbi:GGDEF domain-containing protein [Methylophaga nitratireducenticrescens]|uniref:diguanylate cyclase n=1 Tax=Methylophaga nitratireducenticrescens TaxID=754476 RepID=I1XKQ5_METNJ|nr:diguanylate cyclase [Methylophaga nitratireducenticrescens]AFI84974.1 GGDEF domain-containing protein [Methylophaga nitratireducenticrescens]AUZ84986.1 GGDEF domain-containing protein [Methylophaga nitratireducenticrescens]